MTSRTMKTMALTGLRRMERREAPVPELREPTDVRLRIVSVGVCGSDVHYYTTGRIGSQVVQYPFVVGHECAAVVDAAGPAVTRVRPGDRVAVEPAMPCHRCDQCRAGRPHTCRALRFLGCPGQAAGCLAEYLVMPEECCLPLAAELTAEQGVLAEPLAIGLYAVRQSVPLCGARVAILGAGPIGLSVLVPAVAEGAAAVYVTDPIEARRAVARRAGAAWVGDPRREDVVAAVAAREPLLLDAVFECCGQQEAVDQAVDLLKPGGKLMMVGIPEVDRISLVIDKARRKELCLQNVRRQNHCAEAALARQASGELDVRFMVTHRFPFERTPEAFERVAGYAEGVVKAMVNMGEGEA
jgi:L-iditol 2-dehydrogenase